MDKMSWFVLVSTVVAAMTIAVGVMIPAQAMGRAILQALESLARQPEAEKSITRTLFIGLALVVSLDYFGAFIRLQLPEDMRDELLETSAGIVAAISGTQSRAMIKGVRPGRLRSR